MVVTTERGTTDVVLRGEVKPGWEEILSPEALGFVAELVQAFRPEVRARLAGRGERQARLDAGERLALLPETRSVREGDWTVRSAPADLLDRRVEITGPTDRKMMINALNSGASVFMADLEDATAPTWDNVVEGQVNLRDAARGTIAWDSPDGRAYRLVERPAVLMVRPRGWHMLEPHVLIDGEPATAALVDAGLFLFHDARTLLERGSGPYLYLPKLESHLEARLWEQVLAHAERKLGLPPGSVRVTVLIETLPAAFEMDEILYELRVRIVGLNCGRWDYIFSFIKRHRADPAFVLPDRGEVGMTRPFLAAYTRRVVETCHRRGAHAIGGMAAQIPIKNDPVANEAALAAVRADKEREVAQGHDGTWVAHPGLVAVAKEVFDRGMPGPNQLHVRLGDLGDPSRLLEVPKGPRTEAGLRTNARVAVEYVAAWLMGNGCVPIDHRMEDAATAEISRTQIWQWVHHGARLDDGRVVDAALVRAVLDEEVAGLAGRLPQDRLEQARSLVERLCLQPELEEFLTLAASAVLNEE
ncbi:MAG: malate synthase A [Alphaproteobacteria bacterium]|nr:malate synthase A [Alphaproteobacteria bacterium]